MSNYSNVFPRAELKAEAKKLMRPNWGTILLATLLYLILMGVDSYTYSQHLPAYGTTESYAYSVSGAAGMYTSYFNGHMNFGQLVLGMCIAIVAAILIQGVMTYCYTAFFLRMAERKGEKVSFGLFVEGFSDAIKAALAFLWQYLWTMIWGLTMIPGMVLLIIAVFSAGVDGNIDGKFGALLIFGIILLIAAAVIIMLATLRYMFMYQIIADGRGKVGACQSMRYSIAIVKNHLWDVVVLALSFIPWILLAVFTLGLGLFYVMPYMEATYALSYQWFRDDAFRNGRLDPQVLGYVKQESASTQEVMATVDVVPQAEDSMAPIAMEDDVTEVISSDDETMKVIKEETNERSE